SRDGESPSDANDASRTRRRQTNETSRAARAHAARGVSNFLPCDRGDNSVAAAGLMPQGSHMSEERQNTTEENVAGEKQPAPPKTPSLFRNYTSFTGAAIVAASLTSIVLLFLIELTSADTNPYLGIL